MLDKVVIDGKEYEVVEHRIPRDGDIWVDRDEVVRGPSSFARFILRQIEPPQPKMVPLGPEDIVPGTVIRDINGDPWAWIPVIPCERSVTIPGPVQIYFDHLQENYLIKFPGGEWQRAEKPQT